MFYIRYRILPYAQKENNSLFNNLKTFLKILSINRATFFICFHMSNKIMKFYFVSPPQKSILIFFPL